MIESVLQKAIKEKKDFEVKFRAVWPDETVHYIHSFGHMDVGSDQSLVNVIGVNWDVTKEATIDQQKTEFVSLASHQLKTPVGAMRWNLEMLINGDYGQIAPEQKVILEETLTLDLRMNELVNSLLNVSRIEMGVLLVEPIPTDVRPLCVEVLKEMAQRIAQKGHTITTDFSDKIPTIPVDAKLMRILFQNFLSNAIKYTQDKGKIDVVLKVIKDELVYSVTNNGEPIPAEDQAKIFGKMYRASNAQKQDPDGNGLGLYLVKEIVTHSGGRLWFTSNKKSGTTFGIAYPLTGMLRHEGTKTLTEIQ